MMMADFKRSFGLDPTARDTPDCEWEVQSTLAELRGDDAAYSPHAGLQTLHETLVAKGWTEFTEADGPGADAYTYSRGNLVLTNTVSWSPVDEACATTPVDCGADAEGVTYTVSMTIHPAG